MKVCRLLFVSYRINSFPHRTPATANIKVLLLQVSLEKKVRVQHYFISLKIYHSIKCYVLLVLSELSGEIFYIKHFSCLLTKFVSFVSYLIYRNSFRDLGYTNLLMAFLILDTLYSFNKQRFVFYNFQIGSLPFTFVYFRFDHACLMEMQSHSSLNVGRI